MAPHPYPSLLVVNGRRFARTVAGLTGTLFAEGGTAAGLYKVRKRGVLLCTPAGAPRVFLSSNDGGFFVSATKLESGRTFYMFGLTQQDTQWLGLPASLAAEKAIAVETLAALGAAFPPTRP